VRTDVTAEIAVDRPREQVSGYATDWRNDREWIGALTDVRHVAGPEGGVGSQVLRMASFLGRRIEYVNEVIEHGPGRRLVMRSVKAPFPMTVAYEFEDADRGGTLMRIRALGDASGFYRLAGPLLTRAVKRSIAADLARLKAALEA
jgi:uncharacterized membrane protein